MAPDARSSGPFNGVLARARPPHYPQNIPQEPCDEDVLWIVRRDSPGQLGKPKPGIPGTGNH
jgi:hypothetical protein